MVHSSHRSFGRPKKGGRSFPAGDQLLGLFNVFNSTTTVSRAWTTLAQGAALPCPALLQNSFGLPHGSPPPKSRLGYNTLLMDADALGGCAHSSKLARTTAPSCMLCSAASGDTTLPLPVPLLLLVLLLLLPTMPAGNGFTPLDPMLCWDAMVALLVVVVLLLLLLLTGTVDGVGTMLDAVG
jgi:hypothetical protein